MEEKVFKLYWLDGTTEEIKGCSISIAFMIMGYGSGALAALDYYEEIPSEPKV